MKKLILAIRDAKAEYFQDPVFAYTRAEAIRSLQMAVREPRNMLAQNADDFALFELGSFDPLSARIELHIAPIHVINAWELRAPEVPSVVRNGAEVAR